ncbi:hypothetical protein [Ferrovibrio xuzhouensis]|uniref:SMODS and SLOG-associating 2TM effector domain-containing protein n=1 Tax=Ferrovibrio xuzhouensis TaxID=1576914 RepID=A0ABV7VFK3_9PROT
MTKFDRQTWAQIKYQTILMQYRDSGAHNPFDDAYFSAVERRYEAKFAVMTKLMIAYTALMIILAMSAFGLKPEVSQFGVTVNVDLARELLLFIATVISTFLALIHNDVLLMKSMLNARIRLTVDEGPFTDALFQERIREAIGLRHMDTYMQHLPAHSLLMPELDSGWNRWRAIIIALVALFCLGCFVVANVGLMGFVIYTIWNGPAIDPWLSRSICVFAVASNLLWVTLTIKYRTKDKQVPDPAAPPAPV